MTGVRTRMITIQQAREEYDLPADWCKKEEEAWLAITQKTISQDPGNVEAADGIDAQPAG